MKPAAALALALALGFAGGLAAGWKLYHRDPAPVIIAAPRREIDLSPKGETKTVLAPAVNVGPPTAPPVPAPADLGELAQTTTASIPALPDGGMFHLSTFARFRGDALELRPVVWLDNAQGQRQALEATTTSAPVLLPVPGRSTPRWSAAVIYTMPRGERPQWGAMLQRDAGPFRLSIAGTPQSLTAGLGVVW